MGERFTFQRSKCGYSAEVSGRGDAGYSICTQTILCFDCMELMDVVTAVVSGEQEPWMALTGEIEDCFLIVRIQCEKNVNHIWRLRGQTGECD